MRTVVLGQRPAELEEIIRHRAAIGADTFDEVCEGEYHMAPAANKARALLEVELAVLLRPLAKQARLFPSGAFNLGEPDDFRVPDLGLHRSDAPLTWCPTAALVVEIVSPGDESWEKLPFYAAHDVDEVVVVDRRDRSVRWLRRHGREYAPVERGTLLDASVADIVAEIDWPPAASD